MRLNQFLAAAGLGSRRSCEELILTGQVTINGVLCETLATTVDPTDVVKVGNRVLHTATPATLLLNKPPGFICTASDEHHRQTVFDLLPPNYTRLFHVGRLDRESEGLLILTNDGALALKLTHPRYKVDKEYEVVLDRAFDFELAPKLLRGLSLEEGWAKAEEVHKLAANKLKVVLRQGMKRQIRLMFFALGYEVKKLARVRIGPIEIGNMPSGSWRVLTHKEIEALLAEGAKTAAQQPPARHPRKPRSGFLRPKPSFNPLRSKPHVEEIPFTPRAAQTDEPGRKSERAPRAGARPAPKPFPHHEGRKPATKSAPRSFAKPGARRPTSKPGTRPASGKAAPRPFAKFERRRRDD